LIAICRHDKLKSGQFPQQIHHVPGGHMPATSRTNKSRTRKTSGRQNGRSGKDAIGLLKQDHQTVRQLLKKIESAEEGSERTELLTQIENEVKIHTQIEEEIFYPAFQQAAQDGGEEHLYYEALEEHHVVDMVLPEIKETDEESEEFAAKAKVLKDLIEHHAEEEEKQMFPKARKLMDTSELKELGQQLQQRKQELMSSITGGRRRRAA
jgi:hemerythrin-like domain-containing protein